MVLGIASHDVAGVQECCTVLRFAPRPADAGCCVGAGVEVADDDGDVPEAGSGEVSGEVDDGRLRCRDK